MFCKKGQTAIETLVLVGILTFFLILTLAAVSDDLLKAGDEAYVSLLKDVADVLEGEAAIAAGSAEGYSHPFRLPATLNGKPYAVSITNSTSISSQTNQTVVSVAPGLLSVKINITRFLPRDVRGNLVRGRNTVSKEEGLVVFRPIPLTGAQKAACNDIANPCGSGSGIVTAPECCDHRENPGCC